MTFDELQNELREKVKDISRRVDSTIPEFINEASTLIASEIPLPKLKKFGIIWSQANLAYTDMPDGFGGRLTYVGTADGKINLLAGGIEELLLKSPTLSLTGNRILDAALEDTVLWYQPISDPDPVKLYLVYFANPPIMTDGGESPAWIPPQYHRLTILPKAAELAFSIIEEGIEGDHVNTMLARNEYEIGKALLWNWVYRSRKQARVSAWDV